MNRVNLSSFRAHGDNELEELTKELLKLPADQLAELLISEMKAKNIAYTFIGKKGLMVDFLNFRKECCC